MLGKVHQDIQPSPRRYSRSPAVAYRLGQTTSLGQAEGQKLTLVWEKFAAEATQQLGPFLRCNLQIQAVNFHCRGYQSYLNDFQDSRPSLYFGLEGAHSGCFTIRLETLLAILERMLGGKGQPLHDRAAYLTDLEAHLLARVMDALLLAYQRAWASHQGVKPRLDPGYAQFNPYVALLCSPSDTVQVATFHLRTPFLESTFDLVLPWSWLRRQLALGAASPVAASAGPTLQWRTQQVEVCLHLGQGEVLFGDLLDLQEGDVIKLDTPIRESLQVRVNGVSKFKAYPGVVGRHLGARVCEVLSDPD